MNILTIDTATPLECIAAMSGERSAERIARMQKSHSVSLFASIDAVLDELGMSVQEVHCIGVGIGPGSFTGIRIAVSTARMLAQIRAVPLVPVHSQLLYACSLAMQPGELACVAFDAKKQRVFGAVYECGTDEVLNTVVGPGDYPIEHLVAGLSQQRVVHFLGDGSVAFHERYAARLPRHVLHREFVPGGRAMCSLVRSLYSAHPSRYMDITGVVPDYRRKSDAEVIKEGG